MTTITCGTSSTSSFFQDFFSFFLSLCLVRGCTYLFAFVSKFHVQIISGYDLLNFSSTTCRCEDRRDNRTMRIIAVLREKTKFSMRGVFSVLCATHNDYIIFVATVHKARLDD